MPLAEPKSDDREDKMATRAQTVSELEAEIRELKTLVEELGPKIERMGTRRPILLYSLRHPQLKLKEPLAVLLEDDGEQIIAYSYDLETFGYGDTEGEALDDLRQTVVDLYLSLKDNQDCLGPLPAKIWDYLSYIVTES